MTRRRRRRQTFLLRIADWTRRAFKSITRTCRRPPRCRASAPTSAGSRHIPVAMDPGTTSPAAPGFSPVTAKDAAGNLWILTILALIYVGMVAAARAYIKYRMYGLDDILIAFSIVSVFSLLNRCFAVLTVLCHPAFAPGTSCCGRCWPEQRHRQVQLHHVTRIMGRLFSSRFSFFFLMSNTQVVTNTNPGLSRRPIPLHTSPRVRQVLPPRPRPPHHRHQDGQKQAGMLRPLGPQRRVGSCVVPGARDQLPCRHAAHDRQPGSLPRPGSLRVPSATTPSRH